MPPCNTAFAIQYTKVYTFEYNRVSSTQRGRGNGIAVERRGFVARTFRSSFEAVANYRNNSGRVITTLTISSPKSVFAHANQGRVNRAQSSLK